MFACDMIVINLPMTLIWPAVTQVHETNRNDANAAEKDAKKDKRRNKTTVR